MGNECYLRLQPIISRFPQIHQFLNDEFIRGQWESGLKSYLLGRLDNRNSSENTQKHLPTLEKRLAELASVSGYDRLGPLLRGPSDWDQYQEFLAQVDITLWFKQKRLLKEIEPELSHRKGSTDILLSFSEQDIYCEIYSPQSIIKSIESRKESETIKGQKQSEQIKRLSRHLLEKTDRELSPNCPGILVLETGKSAVFGLDVRELAQRLFPNRPHVALIMLWSWESSEQDESDFLGWSRNTPSFCFINAGAKFREVGEALLKHLSLKGEVVGICD